MEGWGVRLFYIHIESIDVIIIIITIHKHSERKLFNSNYIVNMIVTTKDAR